MERSVVRNILIMTDVLLICVIVGAKVEKRQRNIQTTF
jgi:hypothetical protein